MPSRKCVTATLHLESIVADPDGSKLLRDSRDGRIEDAEKLGNDAGAALLQRGGDQILEAVYGRGLAVPAATVIPRPPSAQVCIRARLQACGSAIYQKGAFRRSVVTQDERKHPPQASGRHEEFARPAPLDQPLAAVPRRGHSR